MQNYNKDFSYNLVKGRIAETLFEQMLRDAGCFTVLSFGYENIAPGLMSRQASIKAEETMEIIRRSPDFVVIDNKNHEVHLVEVKYMKRLKKEYVFPIAEKMYGSWKPSWLFLATPKGFYFSKVSDIVERKGDIFELTTTQISKKLQLKYLDLLNRFID